MLSWSIHTLFFLPSLPELIAITKSTSRLIIARREKWTPGSYIFLSNVQVQLIRCSVSIFSLWPLLSTQQTGVVVTVQHVFSRRNVLDSLLLLCFLSAAHRSVKVPYTVKQQQQRQNENSWVELLLMSLHPAHCAEEEVLRLQLLTVSGLLSTVVCFQ